MIPGEIFTSFAEFQGIVSVNDFWFPLGLQELLQAPFVFPVKFSFQKGKIYPLSSQVLYHHSVSMFRSRFVFASDPQLSSHPNFRSEHDCTGVSSARSPPSSRHRNLGPPECACRHNKQMSQFLGTTFAHGSNGNS